MIKQFLDKYNFYILGLLFVLIAIQFHQVNNLKKTVNQNVSNIEVIDRTAGQLLNELSKVVKTHHDFLTPLMQQKPQEE
jgi:hypothetical protein